MQVSPVSSPAIAPPVAPNAAPMAAPLAAPKAPAVGSPSVEVDHIFDLPGLATGDRFRIEPGSIANGWSVGGDAKLTLLTPTSASLWLKFKVLFVRKEATMQIEQTSPMTVKLTAHQAGNKPFVGDADIVMIDTNHSEFRPTSPPADNNTVIKMDDKGRYILNSDEPAANLSLRLILSKRKHR